MYRGHRRLAVEVQGADGTEKAKQRVTFDLSDMRPGIGERRSAVLPGLVLADDDEVTVELEANLSPDELRRLPEWSSTDGCDRKNSFEPNPRYAIPVTR